MSVVNAGTETFNIIYRHPTHGVTRLGSIPKHANLNILANTPFTFSDGNTAELINAMLRAFRRGSPKNLTALGRRIEAHEIDRSELMRAADTVYMEITDSDQKWKWNAINTEVLRAIDEKILNRNPKPPTGDATCPAESQPTEFAPIAPPPPGNPSSEEPPIATS